MKIRKMLTVLATIMMFICFWNVTVHAEDEIMYYAPSYNETTKTVVGAPEVGTLISTGTVFSGENIPEDITIVIRTYDTEEKAEEGADYASTVLWSGDKEAIEYAGPNGNPEDGWIVSEVYYIEEVMEWGDVLNRIYIEGYANVPPTVIDAVNLSVNWDNIGYFRLGKVLPKAFEGFVQVDNEICESTCDFGLYLKVKNEHVQNGYVTKRNYQDAVNYSGGWLDSACLKSSYKVATTDEFCYRFDIHAADYHVFSYTDNTNVKNRMNVATEGVSVNSAVANYNGGEDNVCIVMLYLGTAQNIVDRAEIKSDDLYYGWKKFGEKWCYFDANGNQVYDQWVSDSVGWCYIDTEGYMATSRWVEDSNGTCYVDENGHMVKSQWIQSEWGDWQYVNADGYLAKDTWAKDSKGWLYLGRYGWIVTDTWIDYDGDRYYVGEDGYMVTNKWFKDSTGWFYLGSEGHMLRNQRAADSKGICFVDEDGYMVYGQWVKDANGWSYVGTNGYIVIDKWMKSGSKWCYVGEDGYMVTNEWVKDSKGWCFVGKDGYMVYDQWVKDSKGWGYAGTDGYRMFNKWIRDSKDWCYVGKDGYMVSNQWVSDSKGVCYTGSDGYILYSKWIKIDSEWYYVNASGYRVTGWLKISGTWYYFKEDGVMAAEETIDGYYLDKNGAWIA